MLPLSLSLLTGEFQPDSHEQRNNLDLTPGIICSYLTDSPLDIDSGMPVEPFGSSADSIALPNIEPTHQAPPQHHPLSFFSPAPIERPDQLAPAPIVEAIYQSYLTQQFGHHRPAVERVGLIRPPGGPELPARYQNDSQRAYTPHPPCSTAPVWFPPPMQDPAPPLVGASQPISLGCAAAVSHLPDVHTLLETINIPTRDELDNMSAQIRKLYALRSLLDIHNQMREVNGISSQQYSSFGDASIGGARQDEENNAGRLNNYVVPKTLAPFGAPPSTLDPICGSVAAPSEFGARSGVEGRCSSLRNEAPESAREDGDGVESWDTQDDKIWSQNLNTRAESWGRISEITRELQVRADAFVFPSRLDFRPPTNPEGQPTLITNSPNNKSFIQYWEFLFEILDNLNYVPTWGSRGIEGSRRGAINRVTEQLNMMEAVKSRAWDKASSG